MGLVFYLVAFLAVGFSKHSIYEQLRDGLSVVIALVFALVFFAEFRRGKRGENLRFPNLHVVLSLYLMVDYAQNRSLDAFLGRSRTTLEIVIFTFMLCVSFVIAITISVSGELFSAISGVELGVNSRFNSRASIKNLLPNSFNAPISNYNLTEKRALIVRANARSRSASHSGSNNGDATAQEDVVDVAADATSSAVATTSTTAAPVFVYCNAGVSFPLNRNTRSIKLRDTTIILLKPELAGQTLGVQMDPDAIAQKI